MPVINLLRFVLKDAPVQKNCVLYFILFCFVGGQADNAECKEGANGEGEVFSML